MTSSTKYDLAGRAVRSTSADGTVTTTDYNPDGLTVTTTAPGGATRITTSYLDGRTKSVTGTGVTPVYYEYGVNTDGTRWTKVYTGTGDNTAPTWTKTTTDFLGRTIKTEKPAYSGATAVATTQYDVTVGRPLLATTPGQADTRYEYNDLGEMIRSGLDVNGDGQLTLASMDRVSDSDTVFEKDTNGHWWRKSVSTIYPTDNAATAVTVSTSKQRVTGLGTAAPAPYSGILVSESSSEDLHGNITTSYTYLDAANKTTWSVTDVPTSTIDAVTKTVNGQVVSSLSPAVVDATGDPAETTFVYDSLGRRTGTIDPRTGPVASPRPSALIHYNTLGQVDYTEDADGNRTTYAYDNAPAGTSEENLINYTGRGISVTNALSKTQYTAYTLRGQVAATWGDTGYPLAYSYDIFGRMTKLYTLRDESLIINSYDAVTANLSSFDKTTWTYQAATGLLTRKEYADGKGTDYTYYDDSKLATRTWARTPGGSALVTTYSYASDTGELVSVDYSDTTPDISYTYFRTGQQKTVTDATGTRAFAYDATTFQLDTETLPAAFYGDTVLTRQYDIKGRNTGYKLGSSVDPENPTQWVGYAYDAYGRFNSVTSSDSPAVSAVTYGYLANSAMVTTRSFPNGLVTTRAYEGNRNLVDYVQNKVGATDISKYTYTNEPHSGIF